LSTVRPGKGTPEKVKSDPSRNRVTTTRNHKITLPKAPPTPNTSVTTILPLTGSRLSNLQQNANPMSTYRSLSVTWSPRSVTLSLLPLATKVRVSYAPFAVTKLAPFNTPCALVRVLSLSELNGGERLLCLTP
jgi:hypothetical protein